VKGRGDEQGGDGDGHHGGGSLSYEAIIQLLRAADAADEETHSEDLGSIHCHGRTYQKDIREDTAEHGCLYNVYLALYESDYKYD
jgi:hypothetical protein